MVLVVIVVALIAAAVVAVWRERRSPQQQGGLIKRSGLGEIRRGEETASIVLGEPGGRPERNLVGEPAPVEASDEAFRAEREHRERRGQ